MWVVIFQSGGVALVPVQIAVKKSHAEEIVAEIVAVSLLFHAPSALAAHAHAHAHVLNVQRYALVAVLQRPVVTHSIYVTSIFKQFHLDALFLNMALYFKWNINFANMVVYKIVSSNAIINIYEGNDSVFWPGLMNSFQQIVHLYISNFLLLDDSGFLFLL